MTNAISLTQDYKDFRDLVKNQQVRQMFEDVMGKKAELFLASLLNTVAVSPALQKCDHNSILFAAMTAATLDLPIVPGLGQACIVPYKGKAQFQFMYKGLIRLCERSGEFIHINVAPVYEGEQIVEDRLTGNIRLNGKQTSDQVAGWVAYFKTKDGLEKFKFMSVEEIHAHARRYSRSYNEPEGPWKKETAKMEAKTPLKLLLLMYAPMSITARQALDMEEPDETMTELDQREVVDSTAEDVTEGAAVEHIEPIPHAEQPTPAQEAATPSITKPPHTTSGVSGVDVEGVSGVSGVNSVVSRVSGVNSIEDKIGEALNNPDLEYIAEILTHRKPDCPVDELEYCRIWLAMADLGGTAKQCEEAANKGEKV